MVRRVLGPRKAARAFEPRLKQNGRFCFSAGGTRRIAMNLRAAMQMPCRFFHSAWPLTDARNLPESIDVMARPKRFELLTPRFVVCHKALRRIRAVGNADKSISKCQPLTCNLLPARRRATNAFPAGVRSWLADRSPNCSTSTSMSRRRRDT